MNSNNTTEVARKVASLPREFYAQSDVSIYDLLRQSGYFDAYNAVSELELLEVFANESSLVADWVGYSEDKRGGAGWYIVSEEGKFIVGHLGKGQKLSFSDRHRAAAFFAKRELESIRES